MSLPPFFLGPLPQLLAQTFGASAASAAYQLLNQQDDYCVLSVQLRHPGSQVIVKLAGHHSAMQADFQRTAFLHQLARTRTDIPVADILAVDTTYTHFPWRYLIQTHLPGTLWAAVAPKLNPEAKYNAFLHIGRAVAQLHSIQWPLFGEIGSAEGRPSFIDALLQRAARTIQQPSLYDRFAEVVTGRRQLFETVHQAALCHDDLHHYNVLFRNDRGSWELAGILDFDKAWAGHSETDLARLDFWDHMMGEGFRQAYTATHPISPLYEQRRLVYQLLWCLEYAQVTPRHRADLRQVCKELGIAPIVL